MKMIAAAAIRTFVSRSIAVMSPTDGFRFDDHRLLIGIGAAMKTYERLRGYGEIQVIQHSE